ncbi:MAG TPA: PilZ domain-containing protein [candidate division Zixibacteria bacterium]|nr:PilZ domain-containing protein [candidate division Zixibacteria bacterium]HEQ98397.1 PilZ domain-containing protein [candidate division Zixibacteria bacterium]
MKVLDQDMQPKVRRKAAETLTAFDLNTRQPMGIVVDMSARGMKLKSEIPATVAEVYYCRIPLKNKVDGRDEVFFDAECRWCKKYPETGRFYSGYILRFPSKKDAAVVRKLIHDWMVRYNEELNSRYMAPEEDAEEAEDRRGLLTRLFKLGEK